MQRTTTRRVRLATVAMVACWAVVGAGCAVPGLSPWPTEGPIELDNWGAGAVVNGCSPDGGTISGEVEYYDFGVNPLQQVRIELFSGLTLLDSGTWTPPIPNPIEFESDAIVAGTCWTLRINLDFPSCGAFPECGVSNPSLAGGYVDW